MSDESAFPAGPDGLIDGIPNDNWRGQLTARDHTIAGFLDHLVDAVTRRDLDTAESLARAHALSEIVSRCVELNDRIRRAPSDVQVADLVTARRPAALVLLAAARLQAVGEVEAFRPALHASAEHLRRTTSPDPVHRARDLSLSAVTFLLAGAPAAASAVARRGADLVEALTAEGSTEREEELDAAAADLAFVFFLTEQLGEAAHMWGWIRRRHTDPRHTALMQADWGLSLVGVILGERAMVSPMTRALMEPSVPEPPSRLARDPWWTMVQTGRAWLALDRLDPQRALEIVRRTEELASTPWLVGPFVLVRAFTLLVNGRARASLDSLRAAATAHAGEEADGNPERVWQLVAMAMALAASGEDLAEVAETEAFRRHPAMGAIAQAYARLVQNDGDALRELRSDVPTSTNPRLRGLHAMILAAAYARAGNTSLALDALQELQTVSERYGAGALLLMLPDSDVAALRALAVAARRPALADVLPVATMITTRGRKVELTEREREVLEHIRRGRTNAQIAAALYISPNTVKFHVANLLRRLGVSTREEAAAVVIADKRAGR